MLRQIHICNYAVVQNLSLDFFPGLNLLTGETGSGKSILVDALGLVLGGRASPDVVRTGQERASVTAVFEAEGVPPWAGWLEEFGLSGSGDNEIIIRREIQSLGKSRLLVNDQPVTVAAMRSLARLLIDLSGQNEHVALLDRSVQLDLLDQFAQAQTLLKQVAQIFRRRRDLENELKALDQSEQERLRTIDLLRFQADELERVRLEPGEDARLEDEKRLLVNVEKLRATASSAFAHLYEEEGSACGRLAAVEKNLEELRRYDPAIEAYLEPLASARAALEEMATYFRDYLGKLEADPARLEEVENRLAQIDRLKRKYGKSIEEILAYKEDTIQRLTRLEHADERRNEVAKELDRAVADYGRAAQALSERRQKAARLVEKNVRGELAQLGMEKTRFEIIFQAQQDPGGARGVDDIEIQLSPNPGEDLRPLEKIASGGELSRLMLALKTVVAAQPASARNPATAFGTSQRSSSANDSNPKPLRKTVEGGAGAWAPTFIFDEVDAGIGGRVAECVGQRLKRLSRNAQVICVTHLPQIACFADHHFYVEKAERSGRTVTAVRHLGKQEERAAELARMLSGTQITGAVLEHAAAMLKRGSQDVPDDSGPAKRSDAADPARVPRPRLHSEKRSPIRSQE
jgi:DNA repair protein RecN (Recombination protein N)